MSDNTKGKKGAKAIRGQDRAEGLKINIALIINGVRRYTGYLMALAETWHGRCLYIQACNATQPNRRGE